MAVGYGLAGGYTPQIDPNSIDTTDPSFMTRLRGAGKSFLGNRDLALALLANSSGPQRQSFGSILGQSMMQADQMKQGRQDDAFKRQYMQAQMAAMQNRQGTSPYGQYQPGDYTPASWAKFLKSNDPSHLERYVTPRQETAKPFQNITRTYPDGSTQQGSFDARTGEFIAAGPVVPPGKKAETDAAGKAIGEASGGQAAKAPVQSSMKYVVEQFRDSIGKTSQGMVMGRVGGVTDYGDAKRFDNLREQLSTELRTVYRIPGEGTLSDREQAQYQLQLPDRNNPPELNNQILNDIEQRTALRLETPIGAAPAAPSAAPGKKRRYNPATGKIE